MLTIQLSNEEQDLLIGLLEAALSDTRMEIADTDNSAYKAKIRRDKEQMQALLSRLREHVAVE